MTIPTPISVWHKAWTADSNALDGHGNPVVTYAEAVERRAQAIIEASSKEVIPPDAAYLNRTETLLKMSVPDVTVYSQRDQIIIGATQFDNYGKPTDGVEYHVEAVPMNNKLGPLPLLNGLVGGTVQIRRVT